jgi:undecaprenyl-diphosphatase
MVSYRSIARFDEIIILPIQGMETPPLTVVMKFFTYIGGGAPVIAITLFMMAILYRFLHHRKELILFLWVVAGSALLNEALKLLFRRARSDLHRIAEANGFSFQSGHSMAAFSLYGVLAFAAVEARTDKIGSGDLHP